VSAVGVRALPLLAVLCRVPLLVEALRAAFDGVADVRSFRFDGDPTLLSALQPDALIVDAGADAEAVADYAGGREIAVVHLDLEGRSLYVLHEGSWEREDGDDVSTDAIRNALLRATLGRRR
jgi:hypothetical protein